MPETFIRIYSITYLCRILVNYLNTLRLSFLASSKITPISTTGLLRRLNEHRRHQTFVYPRLKLNISIPSMVACVTELQYQVITTHPAWSAYPIKLPKILVSRPAHCYGHSSTSNYYSVHSFHLVNKQCLDLNESIWNPKLKNKIHSPFTSPLHGFLINSLFSSFVFILSK